MDDDTHQIVIIFILLIGLASVGLMGVAQVSRYRNQSRNLVQQTCDYAQVANTDTVTELCTKYQQETDTVYLREVGGASRVEAK